MKTASNSSWGNTRYTEEEALWLPQVAHKLGMADSDVVKKCLALAIPQLLGNPFLRRVELKDAMQDWKPSV